MRRFTSLEETTFLMGLNQELEDIDWRLKNTQKTVLRVYNRSGGVLEQGDTVVVSTLYDMAVTTTTAKADPKVFGVVESGAVDGDIVDVITAGYVKKIKVTNADGEGRGEHLITSETAGKAESSSLVMAGTFGIALTNADGGYLSGVVGRLDTGPKRAIGSFSAYKSVQQNDIPDATWTKVTFDTKDWDVNGWYDTSNSKYTPKNAGYYRLTGSVCISDTVADSIFCVQLYKNSLSEKHLGWIQTSHASCILSQGSALVYANGSTDYFEIVIYHNFGVSTSDILAQKYTFFQGEFIGIQ